VGDDRPVGVFDSGVGGLTVARAILELLPHEPLLYVGDTARSPYGPKPLDDIRRYALEVVDYLLHRDVKLLVVACNSVEVSAIGDIAAGAGVPVVGVIDPGVRAAARITRNGRIGMIGTEATVRSGAYDRALAAAGSEAILLSAACPVFVEHVERGDTTSEPLRSAARRYLEPLRKGGVDTVILGCTHYPLLSGLLQMELGPEVVLVSSAEETAKDVYAALVSAGAGREARSAPTHEFLCTGDPASFGEVAQVFLGPEIAEVRAAQAAPVGGGAWS
jgi:glutamate racemase